VTEVLPISPFTSQFTQQCLNCRDAIYTGDEVIAGALSFFTKEPIWMHPRCATWYRRSFGTRDVVDDGWRIVTMEQRCKGGCDEFIVPGEKAYRRWIWHSDISFTLALECHACHRGRNGAVVALPL
jgi:hypothetical protein